MKFIKNYENLYSITEDGKLWSHERIIVKSNGINKTIKGKFLKQRYNRDGYLVLSLYKDTVKKDFLVHRLVAETYIENTDNKPQVNHRDGIKDNNSIENLEWVTGSENIVHAIKNNLITHKSGEEHKLFGRLSDRSCGVSCSTENGFYKEFISLRKAMIWCNGDKKYIKKCIENKTFKMYKHPETKEDLFWKYI